VPNRLYSVTRLTTMAVVILPLIGCWGTSGPNHSQPDGSGAASTSDEKAASTTAGPPAPAKPEGIDLRTLGQVEQAKFTIRTANRIEGIARGKASSIFAHYRAALEKAGWKLSAPLAGEQVTDESASALLIKDGDSIFLSVIPNVLAVKKGTSDEKQFSLGNLGTCDSSKLPQLPGAEKGYGNTISTVYFTDMKVAATAASVRTMLEHDGWQPFEKPFAGKFELPNLARDEYRKEGNSLRVLISPASGKENKSSVEYVIGAIGHQLPAPSDATDVEFDDALWLLRCTIPRDLGPVTKYYLAAVADAGFESPPYLPKDDNKALIVCESKDKDVLFVDLTYDGLNTRAVLHGVSAEARKKADSGSMRPAERK